MADGFVAGIWDKLLITGRQTCCSEANWKQKEWEMKKTVMGLLFAGMSAAALAKGIQVENAWSRATVEGMQNGGVFMVIQNDGPSDDVLVGGSSPVSDRVEVHEHILAGDVMKMREVAGGLPLKKNEQTVLKPGSYHVMLMGLKKPLQEGTTYPLTLKFKKGKAKTVQVEVKNAGFNKPSVEEVKRQKALEQSRKPGQ